MNHLCATGLAWVDHYLEGGIRPGEVLLITGDRKAFKAALGAMIVLHAAQHAGGVLVDTGEWTAREFLQKLESVAEDPALLRHQKIFFREGWTRDLETTTARTAAASCGVLVGNDARDIPYILGRHQTALVTHPMPVVLIDYELFHARQRIAFAQSIHAADHVIGMVENGRSLTSMLIKARGRMIKDTNWSDAQTWTGGSRWINEPLGSVIARTIELAALGDAEAKARTIARLLSTSGPSVQVQPAPVL